MINWTNHETIEANKEFVAVHAQYWRDFIRFDSRWELIEMLRMWYRFDIVERWNIEYGFVDDERLSALIDPVDWDQIIDFHNLGAMVETSGLA